jgi:protein-disulfide isomerase
MRLLSKLVLIYVCAILVLPARAQQKQAKTESPTAAAEPAITRQQGEAILDELRAIHQLLESQTKLAARQAVVAPAAKVKVSLAGAPVLGSKDAPLVLVEFTDYQCPYCKNFHETTFAEIKKTYVDTGKLRFVSRDLPLDFHHSAAGAAQATHCAGEQNKFWDMRNLLITNAPLLGADAIFGYAQQLSLDMDKFKACVAADKYLLAIQKQVAELNALGITGTPTFVLGKANGDFLEGLLLVGAQTYTVFDNRIRDLLGR